MSRKRRSPAEKRTAVAVAVAAAIVAVLLIALGIRLVAGALNLTRAGDAGERDPQFAEPAETVTRPPDLDAQGQPVEMADDPSEGWDQGELTPVDKTAEELVREAEAAD